MTQANDTLIGIGLAILGNLLNAVGYVLQKKGWNTKPQGKKIYQSPLWVIGFVTYAVGGIIFAVALGWASASVLLPLGGLKLAAFAALAAMFLGENIGLRDLFGIFLVTIGAIGAVMTGPSSASNSTQDQKEIMMNFTQLPFLMYMTVTVSAGMAAYAVERKLFRHFKETEGLADTLSKGFLPALTSVPFYFFLIAFIGANFGMEYFKQIALGSFLAMDVIPATEVTLLLLGIIATGLFFDEFRAMSLQSAVFFWGSIALSAVGIYFLSSAEAQKMKFRRLVKVTMRVISANKKFLKLIGKRSSREKAVTQRGEAAARHDHVPAAGLPTESTPLLKGKDGAASAIQAALRGSGVRKKAHHLQQTSSVGAIQAALRGRRVRTICENHLQQAHSLKLQTPSGFGLDLMPFPSLECWFEEPDTPHGEECEYEDPQEPLANKGSEDDVKEPLLLQTLNVAIGEEV